MPKGTSRTSQVKSADRVLDIMEMLATTPHGHPFVELGRQLEIPKSSLHSLLAVLTERGYVEYDLQHRTYSLGIRTWEVGQAYLSHQDLLSNALPLMQGVVDEINETVQLAVLDGIENVYLAKVDCSHPVRLQSEVGKRLYAHATGLGKVLLASLPEAEIHARYRGQALPKISSNTISTLGELEVNLDLVRTRGFAIDDQEFTPGLKCVAVPIVDMNGTTIAAISASIPITRAMPERMLAALRELAAASIEISRRLGGISPDQRLEHLTHWQGDDF
jgi:DNA-binding IclR family transcriptional regulator